MRRQSLKVCQKSNFSKKFLSDLKRLDHLNSQRFKVNAVLDLIYLHNPYLGSNKT